MLGFSNAVASTRANDAARKALALRRLAIVRVAPVVNGISDFADWLDFIDTLLVAEATAVVL
jgi:hypothetical protein